MLLALLFHIPATFLCLLRIRNLDAVIMIMEDIRKLQGLRSIIGNFNRTLEKDEWRQELLDRITKRVVERLKELKGNFYSNFLRSVLYGNKKRHLLSLQQDQVRDHIVAINEYFTYAEDELQGADTWLKVKKEQQDERMGNVKEYARKLSDNKLQPKKKWKTTEENSTTEENQENSTTEENQTSFTHSLSNHSSSVGGGP